MRRLSIFLVILVVSVTALSAQYNREYFFWVGQRSMMNKDYQEAIRVLNTLLRFDDDAFEGYFLRGIAKYNLDDLIGAEADFSAAIERNPVYTQAYTYRAITRSRLGNYDDALRDFEEAISLRPDLPGAYFYRGVTRLQDGRFAEAIEDFDMFIRYEGKVAEAYINRGVGYLNLKDTVAAYENFDAAIKTNRENPDGYIRRGALLLKQGRYAEAEADFDMAVECDTMYLPSFFNRALVYSETNRPQQALSDFDRVVALDSTSSLGYFNRAMLRSQVGDYNRALEDYDRVVQALPNNVLVYYNRASVLARLGEIKRAEQDYTSAINLYPDFANAYIYRSQLRQLLRDTKGAKSDQKVAQQKIEEYSSRLKSDSTYSIYADTTQRFDKLLSFESNWAGSSFAQSVADDSEQGMRLLPLFKFTMLQPDTTVVVERNKLQRVEDFERSVNSEYLKLSTRPSDLAAERLIALDSLYEAQIRSEDDQWQILFKRALTQSLIKQYTNSVNTYSQAIEHSPTNPFIYFNRSTTNAEMVDFISSIDNSYQRIAIDSDPAARLHTATKRTYSYDDAIADLNKAIKLFPLFAEAYYNRANLLAQSGKLPEALADYTKAIELDGEFAEAYYNRGVVQIFLKDTRKGYLDLSKAGELGITDAYEALKDYRGDE